MTTVPVSVIVVSRGRPSLLCRCIRALIQLDHPAFEIVVVADIAGCNAVRAARLHEAIKLLQFDEANVSSARNAGAAEAAGEVLAFIDDDSVPEPSWLSRLVGPFAEEGVSAATGLVLGRNGISVQWNARRVDIRGDEHEIPAWGDMPRVFAPEQTSALKLQGTNMSVRRSVLVELGGFDESMKYFLEDADLSLRLSKSGHRVAFVPRAVVHHGFAASAYRGPDRAPRDLTEIGASIAVFLNRHASVEDRAQCRKAARAGQRRRLIEHMIRGGIEPRDVRRLLAGFDRGIAEGDQRTASAERKLGSPHKGFVRVEGFSRPAKVIAGRFWSARGLRRQAAGFVAQGRPVYLILLSPTAQPHWLRFVSEGWWEQTGGVVGRSVRQGRLVRMASFRRRVAEEAARLAATVEFGP